MDLNRNPGANVCLSVIIPSYKGANILKNNLPGLLTYLKSKGSSFEVIVIDDGSQDGGATEKVASDLGCRLFMNDKNMGKGAAVRNAMLKAHGNFRIFTDVDVPFEYECIERFMYQMEAKGFDVVVGDRTLPGSSYFTHIPLIRRIGSHIFSLIVGCFIAGGYFDTQCGLKGFRAEIAKDLFSVSRVNGFAFDIELIYISLKRNYDIKRLPVRIRNDEGSSVSLIKHSPGMLRDIFRIKSNQMNGLYTKK